MYIISNESILQKFFYFVGSPCFVASIHTVSQYVLQLNRQQRVRVKSFLRRESCLAKSWDVERALAWEDWIQCVQWTDQDCFAALLEHWTSQERLGNCYFTQNFSKLFVSALGANSSVTRIIHNNKSICKEESRDLFTITYLKKNIILLLSFFIVNHEFKFAFNWTPWKLMKMNKALQISPCLHFY